MNSALSRTRLPFVPLLPLLLTAALTACGGGSSSTTETTSTSTSTSTSTGTSTGSGTTASTSTPVTGTSTSTTTGTATGTTTGSSTTTTGTSTTATGTSTSSTSGTSASTVALGATTSSSSTLGVGCAVSYNSLNSSASVKLNSTYSWTCGTARALSGNGVPDHDVGTFPNTNNPNAITAQTISSSVTLAPAVVSSTGTAATVVGYGLNSVKFDPDTGGTCDNAGTSCSLIGGSGTWRMEALGQSSFNFGVDGNNAHVQPGGAYHYHGMPEGLITKQGKGQAMTLIGWALDGFPIYARYGYSVATDAKSTIKVMTGSYKLKTVADTGRPATTLYPMGTFKQDYSYSAGSGDLDECNGRTGVTPEFPNGIYHYFATDTYPYVQRCLKGTSSATTTPGGAGMPPPPPNS